ncbi:MAG: OmpA family protein [Stellaceae bacterium]
MKHRTLLRTSFVLASGGLALAACSSAPQPNAALSQAQAAYATASNDPMVQRSAPHDLADAQDFLQTAQTAWSNNEDKAVVDHEAYMAQRYSQIAQERAKVRAGAMQATAAARIITLSDMLFATGKADLNPQGMQAVGELATFLKNYPNRTVAIAGYTDSTGSDKLNAALSAKRAAVVQAALVQQGIAPSRVEARGLGPSNPVASNSTAAGRQQNRRVEVAISEGGATAGMGSTVPH